MTKKISDNRNIGLDLIRINAFLAIIIYHATWIFWAHLPAPPRPFPTIFWTIASSYARALSFSGFIVVFLSSLLYGQKQKSFSQKKWLVPFVLTAWIVFCILLGVREHVEFQISWDIYPLLLLGFSSGSLLIKYFNSKFGAIVSFILLLVPYWKLESYIKNNFIQQVLVGSCPEDYADWPILPWIFLIWFGMFTGKMLKEKYYWPSWNINQKEAFFWLIPIFLMTYSYKTYYEVPLGNYWACYTFRQDFTKFTSHFLFFLFLIRSTLDSRVQIFLKKIPLCLKISILYSNRYFFLAYLLHYILLFSLLGIMRSRNLYDNPYFQDFGLIFCIFSTEYLTRISVKIFFSIKTKKSSRFN